MALTDDYPILATLVERRPGGQRKLPLAGDGASVTGTAPTGSVGSASDSPPEATAAGESVTPSAPPSAPQAEQGAERQMATVEACGPRGRKQPARLSLTVRFESRPDDPDLGALRESTVWVNDAHPAYRRAVASRSEGYHIALTVAMTLSRLAVEPQGAHDFVSAFLGSWGSVGRARVSGERPYARQALS